MATPVMKRNASTKSWKRNSRWSLPDTTCQPGSDASRRATSGSASFSGRGMRSFAGGRGHDGRALDILVPDLRGVERLEIVAELLERLVEARQRLALARERRRAGEHGVLHVGVVHAAILD